MKNSKKKIKRRYLINKEYQLSNALVVTLIQIPCVLVTGLIVTAYFLFLADSRMTASFNTDLFWTMALICLIISAGVAWLSIRFTHAVAGPVDKTGHILRQMARGRLPETRIAFRKNDRFKELSKALNEVADAMGKDKARLSHAMIELAALQAELAENPKAPAGCLEKIDALRDRMSRP